MDFINVFSSDVRYTTVLVIMDVGTNLCPPTFLLYGNISSNSTVPVTLQEDYKIGGIFASFQVCLFLP